MKYSPTTPKTKSPNPIRVRYEKACWCRLFYFDGKNTQSHQFDYRYSSEAPNRFSDWAS
ncbi:hypothetical protein [Helicobacter pylori]|uniref:hypothetical protein n=1 Tax=Helicobacter pylori TaxID=210 RepID=UPI0012B2CAC7|nr:hypothetical protein [Helicobacter pylori]